jgi:predicted DNA-binding protein YlxM (UPF0122 family)
MAYEEEKAVAQLMFEQDRKSAKDIATQIGVPFQTVYRWIKDGKWKQSKVERLLNKVEQLKNLRELVDKQTQELLSSDNPDQAKLNVLRGYQRLLAEFEKTVDMRGTILQGMDAFVKFMRSEHPEGVDTLLPYFQEFPTWVRKNYPEIK